MRQVLFRNLEICSILETIFFFTTLSTEDIKALGNKYLGSDVLGSIFLKICRLLSAGGTAHKRGMPGLIRDVTVVPGDSHLGLKMNEISFVNKVCAI